MPDVLNCSHNKVQEDRFSKLPGVRRSVPGDVACADCCALLLYLWNGGKPVPVEQAEGG